MNARWGSVNTTTENGAVGHDFEQVDVRVSPNATAVVSVRLTRPVVAGLLRMARSQNRRLSDVLRDAAEAWLLASTGVR